MTAILGAFPDMEEAFIALLSPLARAATETPGSWDGNLPFFRVVVFGGGDNSITDVSRLALDAFGATKADAYDLAEAARTLLTAPGARVLTGVVVDQITTDTKPHQVAWSTEPSPVRYAAAYRATARRR